MIKSKKGFTLVELCVVLALISIVVTMVTGFIAVYRKNVYEINTKGTTMTELNALRTQIKVWLDDYDNVDYEASVGANSVAVKERLTGAETEAESVLGVSGKKLKISGPNQRELTFETIDRCEFRFDDTDSGGNEKCIMRCKVYLTDSSSQELVFAMQANLIKVYQS